jgi:hypothetical protein
MKNCTLRRVWVGVQSSPPLFYVFALILLLLFGPSRAKADIYDSYVFTFPGTSTTYYNPTAVTETITGSFTFDATTGDSTAVSITLSGGASPFDGTYINPSDTCALPCSAIYGLSGASTLFVHFVNPLSGSPDPLQSTEWSSASLAPYLGLDSSPTGSAVFSAAVPEPGSVIQLMTVVAMVGFLTRRKLVVGVLSKRSPNPTA